MSAEGTGMMLRWIVPTASFRSVDCIVEYGAGFGSNRP
jgi:hypothetical protein